MTQDAEEFDSVFFAMVQNPECFFHFDALAEMADIPRDHVRRHARELAAKGFAEYSRYGWTDSGEMYGAGYGITEAGIAHYNKKGVST